jgi:hypothetical protein
MENKFKLLIVFLFFIGFLGLISFFPEVLFSILPEKAVLPFIFILLPVSVFFACYMALSFARGFIHNTWYKKYQEVYAKHISFYAIEEAFSGKASSYKVFFIAFFLSFIIIPLINSYVDLVQVIQLFIGYLLAECYFLLDFLLGICFFSWLKKHPDEVAGKTTFDKKATKAVEIIALSRLLILIFILALLIQSFYLYGFLCYLLVNYIRLLVFNRLPLRVE